MYKRILVLLPFLVTFFYCNAQQIDSIRYKNGFLFYEDFGKGEPIVLLSGGPGGNASQLMETSIELAKKYRVILFEQRGTGRSIPVPMDSSTINFTTAVNDINTLLNALHLPNAIFCGHSWGGSLAMYFATAFPQKVKALVLIAPGFFSMGAETTENFYSNRAVRWSQSEKNIVDSLSDKRDKDIISSDEFKLLRYMQRLPYVAKKERLDTIYNKINVPSNAFMQKQLFEEASKSKIDLRTALKNFTRPVSIICGSTDFLSFASYELKISYPSWRLQWIPDCGHFPMFEQPKAFYKALDTAIQISM